MDIMLALIMMAIGYIILYYIIKAAVREGIREARKDLKPGESPPPIETPLHQAVTDARAWPATVRCPQCGHTHHISHTTCPKCGQAYETKE